MRHFIKLTSARMFEVNVGGSRGSLLHTVVPYPVPRV